MKFNEWLKERRLELNLSQKDFAEKLGVHEVSINYLENGKRSPNFKTVAKLSEFLGISTMDIQRVISKKD